MADGQYDIRGVHSVHASMTISTYNGYLICFWSHANVRWWEVVIYWASQIVSQIPNSSGERYGALNTT